MVTGVRPKSGIRTQDPDGINNKTKRVIWNEPGNDITGMVARSQKIAGTAEKV